MKKFSWKKSAVLAAALVLLAGRSARADDSAAPCWRGNPGTTFANWDFAVSNNPAAPDAFTNPNGAPQAAFTLGTFGTGWKASSLGRTGVWDLGQAGQVSLTVPNFTGSFPWKYVQVQVSYFDAPGFYVAPATSISGATLVSSEVVSNAAFGPGTWRTQVTLWLIQPSPSSETVVINGDPSKGLVIDQIIVDTRCPVSGNGDVAAYRPCWRGQPGSTFQQWLFGVSNNPAAIPAELVTNAFGAPQASIASGPFSTGYIFEDSFLGCRQGIWDLGQFGTMTLQVPNAPGASPTSYKYVRVQVSQYRDGLYNASATVSISGGTLLSQAQTTNETTVIGRWVVAQSIWRVGPPSPGSESIVLTGGTNGSLIDQVVVDTLSLDFPCPSDNLVNADAGLCSKSNVTWLLPAVNGCTITNTFSIPASGSTFAKGTNLVTSVIQDGEGGSRTCNFSVVVEDHEAPTVTCPADITVPRDPSQCGAFVLFSPGASDNCPGVTASSVPASGSLFPLGLTTVTCTSVDASSNVSASCNFHVRVVDFTGDLAAYRPCWRGQANSTFQQWAFSVSNNPAAIPAELVTNAFGTPQASLVTGPFSSQYIESDGFLGCRQGIWDLGQFGTMTLQVPNAPGASPTSYKYVRVQVSQYRDGLYNANATVSISGGTLLSQAQTTNETTVIGRWVVAQSIWRVGPPAPGSESIVLTGGTNGSLIDQVVVDTLSLDFPCPSDILVNTDPGQCSRSNVAWLLPAVNGCTITNTFSTPASGSTFAKGTNLVTSVIQDGEGGNRTCNFRVVVEDHEAPTVTCPADITVPRDPSQCGAFVMFSPGATDNCPGATASSVPASGSLFPLGLTTVTCTSVDASGNTSASCNFNVRVIDFTGDFAAYRPCWRGQANSTFQQWAFSVSNNPAAIPAELVTNAFGAPQASLVTGPFSSQYIESDGFLGCRQGIWDLGQFGTMTLQVPNAPGASPTSYKYVRVQVSQYRDGLYNANATVSISGGTLLSQAQTTNETTVIGRWVVAQSIWRVGPPSPASEAIVLTGGTNGSLIDQVVVDTLSLDFPCPSDILVNADAGLCSKSNVTWLLPAVNGCTITNVTSSVPNGSTFAVGVNPVTSVIYDGEGGSRVCNFNVTVVDNQPPVALCRNITVFLDGAGQAVITGADVDNGSSDNCAIATRTVLPNSFNCANVGPNNVVLTVTDVNSNSATCNATVTVTALADLSLTITASPGSQTVGSNLVYTVSVSNAGPCTASGVTVNNLFSGGQVAVAVTNGANGQAAPFPGPAAWWRAEANANDSAGANHGVATAVNYVAGEVGQSFNFDGSTASITVPDAPALRPSSITIEGWIKAQDVTGVHVIIGKRLGPGTLDSYSVWVASGVIYAAMADNSGSGPFLTWPEFPTSSIFSGGDLIDLQDFAYKLQPAAPADQVSWFIKTNLSAATTALLAAYAGGPDVPLRTGLTRDLNAIIQSGSIYDAARFAGVTLSAESQYVLGRNPMGSDLVRLNRFLIRDAYPTDFMSTVFPQLNQRYHVAYSFDPATQVQALYINGAFVNAGLVNKTIAYDSHPVLIGADDNAGSPGFFYQGDIDELTLYNRALTGTEIRAIYDAHTGGKTLTPGSVSLGNLASGGTAQFTLSTVATSCPNAAATATVSSSTADPNAANNSASASVTVMPLPFSELTLTIERVSINNNLWRIDWPLICSPYVLETTGDLNNPVIWNPAVVPVQMINNLNSTIIPADDPMRVFRVRVP